MLFILVLILIAAMMFVPLLAWLWFTKNGVDYIYDGETPERSRARQANYSTRFIPWRYPFYLEAVTPNKQANYSTRFMPWRYGDEASREYSE